MAKATKASGKVTVKKATKADIAAAAEKKGRSLKQRANKKIYENLKDMSEEQLYVQTHSGTNLTLEETLMKDLKLNDEKKQLCVFGKHYYSDLRHTYRRANSLFASLAVGAADASEANQKLLEAI